MPVISLLPYGLDSMLVLGDGCVAVVGIKPTLRDYGVDDALKLTHFGLLFSLANDPLESSFSPAI